MTAGSSRLLAKRRREQFTKVEFKISILFHIWCPSIKEWADGTLINRKIKESWYDILDYMPKLPKEVEDKLDEMSVEDIISLVKYDLDDLRYEDSYDGDTIIYTLPCTIEIN